MIWRYPLIAIALAVQAVCFFARPAAAAIGPLVTITQLQHGFGNGYVQDYIIIPGPGYTGNGFTAAIHAGIVVTIRFEAPAGKKFVVHAPAGVVGEEFFLNTFWQAGGPSLETNATHTVSFENFLGVMPTEIYSLVELGTGYVQAEKYYQVNGPFEFTAIQIAMTPQQPQFGQSETFGAVESYSSPSWGASATTSGTDASLLEMVDSGVVGTARTSWGRIKSLYH